MSNVLISEYKINT